MQSHYGITVFSPEETRDKEQYRSQAYALVQQGTGIYANTSMLPEYWHSDRTVDLFHVTADTSFINHRGIGMSTVFANMDGIVDFTLGSVQVKPIVLDGEVYYRHIIDSRHLARVGNEPAYFAITVKYGDLIPDFSTSTRVSRYATIIDAGVYHGGEYPPIKETTDSSILVSNVYRVEEEFFQAAIDKFTSSIIGKSGYIHEYVVSSRR